jgi:hypothetical protein
MSLVLHANCPIDIEHGGEMLTLTLRWDGRIIFDGPRSFAIVRRNASVKQPRTESEFRHLPENTQETT